MLSTFEKIKWIEDNFGDVVPIYNDWYQYFEFRTHNYIWIDKLRTKYEVWLAGGKTKSRDGTIQVATFSQEGFTGEAYTHHISLWPIRDADDAKFYGIKIKNVVDQIYDRLIKEYPNGRDSSSK